VDEQGTLEDFRIERNKKFFTQGPVRFQFLFRNEGSVHLNPYGEIRIKNLFGQEVDFVEVEPWFAMPQSLRLREVEWNRSFLLGRYTAETSINRGYDDIIDEDRVVFYVFPLHILFGVLGVLILILLLFKFIGSKLEIKIKTK
jgi:hypothetical protein